MRILLDTHAVLWWLMDDPHLSAICAAAIDDPRNTIAISAVSAYEIRFKARKDLLLGGDLLAERLPDVIEQSGFVSLPVTLEQAIVAGALPLTHRDPFDRMLAAQAAQGDYRIASVDTAFDLFGVERVW